MNSKEVSAILYLATEAAAVQSPPWAPLALRRQWLIIRVGLVGFENTVYFPPYFELLHVGNRIERRHACLQRVQRWIDLCSALPGRAGFLFT